MERYERGSEVLATYVMPAAFQAKAIVSVVDVWDVLWIWLLP